MKQRHVAIALATLWTFIFFGSVSILGAYAFGYGQVVERFVGLRR